MHTDKGQAHNVFQLLQMEGNSSFSRYIQSHIRQGSFTVYSAFIMVFCMHM